MIYISPLMKNEINKEKNNIKQSVISSDLLDLLDFIDIDGCIFFKFQKIDNEISRVDANEIAGQFLDLSGYEVSINRFHIDDYVSGNILCQSILFLDEFKKRWKEIYPDLNCVVLITFQNDEIGEFSTFTFHKVRNDESIFDPSEINNIEQAILVEFIN
ncbi:hypothetical protein RFF20_02360 [Pasteurella multocida]|uniref:Uncharacterized protein n=2 Tax=Pasteurella TaxID=745 RepID=C9PRI1_9PAST|nr:MULTISPECIES: hypothetical protein [Pasteurella]EEX50082.1 hypothetical protein HMPREF0621_1605 [Pasteurella dagmatis ATCC 43325]WRK09829.1 hypothetical protein RFF20_02360 [Pasteurella multocida]SNV62399.1 Uncharacterised protein [Pasteurella dagmatis]